MSGRAVRVESLDDISVANYQSAAAKQLSGDFTYGEFKEKECTLGLKEFIKEISEPCTDPLDPKVKWTKVNLTHFEEGFSKYFTTKDMQVLKALYREFHDLSKDELDAITGKAIPVAES